MDAKSRMPSVVLAAHGVPANDYPSMRVGLMMVLEMASGVLDRVGLFRAWRESLDRDCRQWPRTPENDPYKMAAETLAARLSERLEWPAMAAYNEFCAPKIDEAIAQAVEGGAPGVVVVPTMLLRGNSHTETEIRAAVHRAQLQHPKVPIFYAWPFDEAKLVSLLAEQVSDWASFPHRADALGKLEHSLE